MTTLERTTMQNLEKRILHYTPPAILGGSPNDCLGAAEEWGRLFCELGRYLRLEGMHRHIRTVTVGRPMDLVAIQVLQLACSGNSEEDGSEVVGHLAEMLSGYLFDGREAMARLQASVANVLRRLFVFQV